MADITNWAWKGAARVFFAGRELGLVDNLELAFETDEEVLKDTRTCAGGTYAASIEISDATFTIQLRDYSPENVAMAFFGTTAAVAAAGVTDESITAPADLASGDRLVKTAFLIDTAVAPVVTTDPAGTTYTVDVDYEVLPTGILILSAGSISASAALLVDYTKEACTEVEAIMSSSLTGEILINAANCAQSGAPLSVEIFSASISPAEAFGVIGSEFAAATLTGKMQADTTKGTSVSQYFKAKFATTV